MSDPRVVSLNHRLRNLAVEQGVPPQRVRNRYAFQRVLARLAGDPRWVLKGGFSLELRIGLAARTTKDLDLLLWDASGLGADGLQDVLDEALELDLDDDCSFLVRRPRQVRAEDEMPSTWRVIVDMQVVRSSFETVTLDVVTRDREPVRGLEPLVVAPLLGGKPFAMRSVGLARHAAEKAHAYARIYAHERPSSRVKDLVDLALMIERGLLEPLRFADALRDVFLERDGAPPPRELPDPPGAWSRTFTSLAAEIGLGESSLLGAAQLVQHSYMIAIDSKESR